MSLSRPVPHGTPLVWSDNRQALCDALWYFKQHQAGSYPINGVLRGFLLDGEPTIRDMMTPDVIISTLGGGRVKDPVTKQLTRVSESRPSTVKACKAALATGKPVAVLVGKKCVLADVEVPHNYNVVDWFTVTDIWVEKDGQSNIFIWKFRLERTDRTTPSWCQPHGEVEHTVEAEPAPYGRERCFYCMELSLSAFEKGWVCLNGGCSNHFNLYNGYPLTDLSYAGFHAATLAWCVECKRASKTIFAQGWTCSHRSCSRAFTFPVGVDVGAVSYSEEFLLERTTLPILLDSLLPDAPDPDEGSGTDKEARVGIVCPQCHGCSRRISWNRWFYENGDCNYVLPAPPRPYSVADIELERQAFAKRKSLTLIKKEDSVIQRSLAIGGYQVEQYFLPNLDEDGQCCGTIHVFRATDVVNAAAKGPNQLWMKLQRATAVGLDFKRNAVKCAGTSSEILTRNFQQNWGAPYKFVVPINSTSFKDAPPLVLQALMRLIWAGQKSVSADNEAFKKRVVRKSALLSSQFLAFNEMLAIGYMEDDAISYHDDGEYTLGSTVATLSLGSSARMMFAKKKKYAANGGVHEQVLAFPLHHGDMVVMHGTQIHRQYDHKVDPAGKRRYALTCRRIIISQLPEDQQADAKAKGKIPESAYQWEYDGF